MNDIYPYPIARIGLIGGGQLGRMTVKAAKRIGCSCIVLDPFPDSPAGQLASRQIIGDYHDPAKLRELAEKCDVITFELEDIGADTLAILKSEGYKIHPSPQLLSTIQDKLTQKQFLREHGIPTADFVEITEPTEQAFADFGYPMVQKARRGGYDGRGVAVLKDASDYNQHLPVPSLLERFVEAEKEIAVMVARNEQGECVTYPPVEMCVRPGENVLDLLLAPAELTHEVSKAAEELALRTVEALDGVGIFGIEMFLDKAHNVLINEIAPRSHNSGHHTIEANITDQFEQHLRAILNLPLGSTEILSPAAMINLLGAADASGKPVIKGLQAALRIPGVCLHLYGKASTKPFRKMGHVTVLDSDLESAREKAVRVRDLIEITAEENA